jgi:hypothetical protein
MCCLLWEFFFSSLLLFFICKDIPWVEDICVGSCPSLPLGSATPGCFSEKKVRKCITKLKTAIPYENNLMFYALNCNFPLILVTWNEIVLCTWMQTMEWHATHSHYFVSYSLLETQFAIQSCGKHTHNIKILDHSCTLYSYLANVQLMGQLY